MIEEATECPRCHGPLSPGFYGPCIECREDVNRKLEHRMAQRDFVRLLGSERWLA